MNIKTLLFIFLPFSVVAQNATVFAVHDGDSYKIRMDSSNKKVWVRLWGVDCPEVVSNLIYESQPYGKFVGDTVRTMLKGKRIQVDSISTDIFNRPIVKVQIKIDTSVVDLTELLLFNGWAWPFNNSNIDQTTFSNLLTIQKEALADKRGLWADEERINPTRWRRMFKRR